MNLQHFKDIRLILLILFKTNANCIHKDGSVCRELHLLKEYLNDIDEGIHLQKAN